MWYSLNVSQRVAAVRGSLPSLPDAVYCSQWEIDYVNKLQSSPLVGTADIPNPLESSGPLFPEVWEADDIVSAGMSAMLRRHLCRSLTLQGECRVSIVPAQSVLAC